MSTIGEQHGVRLDTSQRGDASTIARTVAGVGRRARLMLTAQRIAWVIGTAIAALIVGGLLDYLLRAPAWLRGVGLLGAMWLLWVVIGRYLLPAVTFRPTPTQLALRIEGTQAGRSAGLPGQLASALELGARREESGAALAAPVIAEADERLRGLSASGVMAPAPTARAITWGVAWVMVLAGLLTTAPMLTLTGVARMLAPWSGAEWPKRTALADVTDLRVHPQGAALALRAALTRTDRVPEQARVQATYRLIVDGQAGPNRRVLLTHQGRNVDVPRAKATDEKLGALFERLIEPAALRPEERGKLGAGTRVELEYSMSTADDQTQVSRVLLVEPPAVLSARAQMTPPEYARGSTSASDLDLGPGSDERAAPPPTLVGSKMAVRFELSKPVPGAAAEDHAGMVAWAARTLGTDAARLFDLADDDPLRATLSIDGSIWTLRWRLNDSVRLMVRPTDEHGITAREDAAFRFDAVKDNPPSVSVVTPSEDKAVLPTAVIELVGEGRDDIGLGRVALERQLARRPAGSAGAAPEPAGERVEISTSDERADAANAGPRKTLRVESSLDLSRLDLKPGDELWITALAADAFELDGARHEPVRSSVRKLRVLSRDELIEQIWSELGGVRRSAIRLDQDQAEAAQAAQRSGEEAARRSERAQAAISERLSRQSEALAQVQRRIDENGLDDASLREVVKQSSVALEDAGKKSVQAAGAMGHAAQAQSQEGAPEDAGKQEREAAAAAQQDVREELTKLIEMLDRGEDTFASKRALERLLRSQRELQERTSETGKSTTGKPTSELSESQRQALERIAQDQRALSQQLSDALQKMNERSKKLAKTDPAAAQAMDQAARRAQREQTASKMEQAATQARQNQVGAAQQQQAQAAQSLEQMLKDIEQTAANRDEVLRRQLASLIESLEALIQQQKTQLDELSARAANGRFGGLDVGMVQLHQQTLGVLEQAQAAREFAQVATLIAKAADAQASAVSDLRASPVRDREARTSETTSLDKLTEARDLANKLDQQASQRQQERAREELRRKYQEALDRQIALRDRASALGQGEATRRTRAEIRSIGERQASLRQDVDALFKSNKELGKSTLFEFSHKRLDSLMSEASDEMTQGGAGAGVVDRQTSATRVLKSLVNALSDPPKKNKPFREGESGGGSGSGGQQQPLLPPSAEVALLRDMQREAAEITRFASEDPGMRAAQVQQAAELQGELARLGQELLKRMSERDRPDRGAGTEPGPEVQPAPEDRPGTPQGGG